MKNKKVIIIVVIAILILIATIATIIVLNHKEIKPEDSLNKYISLLNENKYEEMYELLSKEAKGKISQEDFVKKNKSIHEGIDASNVKLDITDIVKEDKKVKIVYDQSMNTSLGEVKFANSAYFEKEDDEYKINWSTTTIHPELKDGYKVRVKTLKANRGSIIDRNGYNLAYDGTVSQIGIVPGKLGDNKTESISKISELLEMSVEKINSLITASYVKDDTFVPIKSVAKNNDELKTKLLAIPGIMINDAGGRIYDLGEEAAHLIGYVQNINADELEKKKDKGYTATSLIGKAGLELAYEDKLKATDGKEIYIENEDGEKVFEIAKIDKKNGDNIKLTIDSNIQQQLYSELKNDKGLFVVMQPQTGELLALVSTPSYNSNDFVLGISNDKWNELNNNESKPLFNRFTQSYCPGSTFKPITAAIGLETGMITTEETLDYSGTSWQKDSSWGDYRVTTLTAYSGPKNLRNAIIHSDNIYFAQAALKIGTKNFTSGLDKLGFNQQLEFPLSLTKSKYSNSNTIESDGKLADSGFGQGNILVNPIHMASIYSSFANEGNMVKPYIEYKENAKGEYWKTNIFSKEIADIIKDDLIQVVENPEGTATDMRVSGITIAGKTGTAELKQDKEDNESGTLGWFNCFTIRNNKADNLLVIGMVENVQNNTSGGSHYLIPMIKKIF